MEDKKTYFLDYPLLCMNKTIKKWTKGCIIPFP